MSPRALPYSPKLNEAAPFWKPQDVVVDFETAEHTAVSRESLVPWCRALHGCLFHLGQNLDRHAKSLTNYIDDDEGRMLLNALKDVAFIF